MQLLTRSWTGTHWDDWCQFQHLGGQRPVDRGPEADRLLREEHLRADDDPEGSEPGTSEGSPDREGRLHHRRRVGRESDDSVQGKEPEGGNH